MPFRMIAQQLVVILLSLTWSSPDVRALDPSPAAARPDQPLLTAGELDALVAPVALHPDTLLAEVLMASTYPLEVVQADRWMRDQKLKEDALKAEADKQPWDRSIKALVATPTVLEMMSKQLDWTEKLGNAALAQQADVMAAIQRLRSKAYDNKKLTSTKEQTVTLSQADDKRVVAIAPTTPDIISVPYYDPAVVYDPWPYSDDPPYSFAAPDYIPAGFIGAGIVFGAGYLLGRWTDGGNYWGGGIYWDRGDIAANRPINSDRDRITHWQHDPRHRRGLEYPHANVRQKFASTDSRPGREARDQLRTDRHTTLKPGAGRRGAADRSAVARKASAAKKSAATRPSPKSAAARAKRPSSGQRRAHASARPSRSARVAPRPVARASVPRHRPRYAGFSRPGRSFGGGGFRGRGSGRSFGGGGLSGGRRRR